LGEKLHDWRFFPFSFFDLAGFFVLIPSPSFEADFWLDFSWEKRKNRIPPFLYFGSISFFFF
jgi:hypothetical protein